MLDVKSCSSSTEPSSMERCVHQRYLIILIRAQRINRQSTMDINKPFVCYLVWTLVQAHSRTHTRTNTHKHRLCWNQVTGHTISGMFSLRVARKIRAPFHRNKTEPSKNNHDSRVGAWILDVPSTFTESRRGDGLTFKPQHFTGSLICVSFIVCPGCGRRWERFASDLNPNQILKSGYNQLYKGSTAALFTKIPDLQGQFQSEVEQNFNI